jgi:plasmid stabilization system protein ParE
MKEYKVRITTNAFEDMKGIKLYITNELCNHQAADKLINEFYEAIESLSSMPERHNIISEKTMPITVGLRRVPVGNYNIFYRCLEDEGVVSIIRVLYDKREWKSLV